MYIIILDYEENTVHYLEHDFENGSDDIEDYLTEELSFSLNTISWMCSDQPFELRGFENEN